MTNEDQQQLLDDLQLDIDDLNNTVNDQQDKISDLTQRLETLETADTQFPLDIATQSSIEQTLFQQLTAIILRAGTQIYTIARDLVGSRIFQGESWVEDISAVRKACYYISGVKYCVPLGLGVVSSDRATAQTAAKSLTAYTVGSSDGSFIVSGNILVTTSTTHNFNLQVTYTDEGNTSRTVTMNVQQLGGTLITAITNVTGVGPYEGVPLHIRAKAGTTITILTAGTFTAVTYNVEGVINEIN